MTNNGRRASDRLAQRKSIAFTALALAISLLNCYVSYRAITAMDKTERLAFDAYVIGKKMRSSIELPPIQDEE